MRWSIILVILAVLLAVALADFSGDHRAIRSPKKHSSSSSERKKWGRDRHDHGSKWKDTRGMTTKKPGIFQKIKNAIG